MSRITRGALVLLIVIGSARAGYHLMRLVILAGIGLAGMYMLHKLAQDYNKIQANRPGRPGGVAAAAGKALLRAISKRSVDEEYKQDCWRNGIVRIFARNQERGKSAPVLCLYV